MGQRREDAVDEFSSQKNYINLMTVQNLNPIYSACVRFIAGTKGILAIIYLFYAVSNQPTHYDAIV